MSTTEKLKDFQIRKEDLLSIARRLSDLSVAVDQPGSGRRITASQTALAEERFNLAVLGGFKRGKSTFVNALIGAELLPSGVVPLTSIVTKVRYGEKATAVVSFLDGRQQTIESPDLALFITERGNPGNSKGVAEVDVFFNSNLLKDGVTIVDTPGTGSTYEENTRVTHEFVGRADAAIFVLTVDPPIGMNELEFVRMVRPLVARTFFILNKIDYVREEEWQESLDFSSDVVAEALRTDEVKIYPLSSRSALEGRMRGDSILVRRSGIEAFEEDLDRFLAQEKGAAIIANATSRLSHIASDMMVVIQVEHSIVERPMADLEQRISRLRIENERSAQRMKEATYLIDGKEKEILSALEEDLARFTEGEKGRVTENLKGKLAGIDRSSRRAEYIEAVATAVRETIIELLTPFAEQEQEMVSQRFGSVKERFRTEALEVLDGVRKNVADAFDLEITSITMEMPIEERRGFDLDIRPLIPYDMLFVGEVEAVLPRPMLARLVEGKALKMIHEELEKNAGRFRYDMACGLSKSVTRLKREYEEILREIVAATEAAISSGLSITQKTAEEVRTKAFRLSQASASLKKILVELEE
jgi:GTPase SAR1 family protein